MAKNLFAFEYDWQPFTVGGKHLTFTRHKNTRLRETQCSHWGAAVYKWEGALTAGPHIGETGILIGETDDIRQRIKQYVSGQQPGGNAYWRSAFLEQGDIRLYILQLKAADFRLDALAPIRFDPLDFSSGNRRVAYEQTLIMREVESKRPDVWIVNRKL